MQTTITESILQTSSGREAESILRKCVHCGFCTATCPTYQLLGDELDGPRGRIYLIKQLLEGQEVTDKTQLHLDRCLGCRNCESTCPSGVQYGRLLDIGREKMEQKELRSHLERVIRRSLRWGLTHRKRFGLFLGLGRLVRPLLPRTLKNSIPKRSYGGDWPDNPHERTMLVLQGCVQPALAPTINTAAARVLDKLGIHLVAAEDSCCGAVSHHLSAIEEGLDFMRTNIDAWWPYVEQGIEAIVMTASGCGSMVKEYGHLLQYDADYAEKALRISQLARDLSEIVAKEDLTKLPGTSKSKVAFHPPCSLQHGQQLKGVVEQILIKFGFELTPITDSHLCCGSAGTYSILQSELSDKLKLNKISALTSGRPDVIATANIGCQSHLQSGTYIPVKHWIELLDSM